MTSAAARRTGPTPGTPSPRGTRRPTDRLARGTRRCTARTAAYSERLGENTDGKTAGYDAYSGATNAFRSATVVTPSCSPRVMGALTKRVFRVFETPLSPRRNFGFYFRCRLAVSVAYRARCTKIFCSKWCFNRS